MRDIAIGDTHGYAVHPAYEAFCQDTAEEFAVDRAIFIGDMADMHTISRYSNDENAEGAAEEFRLTKAAIQRWHRLWPEARVCIGNHDERIMRVTQDSGAPSEMLKTFNEMWETPGWVWGKRFVSDGMLYLHGHEKGAAFPPTDPARNHALKAKHSTCMGHYHSKRGAGALRGIGGTLHWVNTGCGVDEVHHHMKYSDGTVNLALLGCAVIVDGVPFSIPMRWESRGDPYHKSRHLPKRRRR